MSGLPSLLGQRFGRLIVLSRSPDKPRYYRRWLCLCDCGTKKVIMQPSLRSGDARSCGCLHAEIRGAMSRTHGHAKQGNQSCEYRTWSRMIFRCENPKDKRWKDYGGRGIRICKRWRNSFEQFLLDMGPRPSAIHSIDRFPNNDGNYEPGNCRWATRAQQANNSRANRKIKFSGRLLTVREWEDELGFNRATLHARLNMLGWSVEKALTTPVRPIKKRRIAA